MAWRLLPWAAPGAILLLATAALVVQQRSPAAELPQMGRQLAESEPQCPDGGIRCSDSCVEPVLCPEMMKDGLLLDLRCVHDAGYFHKPFLALLQLLRSRCFKFMLRSARQT